MGIESDVHCGYDLDFDPWPFLLEILACTGAPRGLAGWAQHQFICWGSGGAGWGWEAFGMPGAPQRFLHGLPAVGRLGEAPSFDEKPPGLTKLIVPIWSGFFTCKNRTPQNRRLEQRAASAARCFSFVAGSTGSIRGIVRHTQSIALDCYWVGSLDFNFLGNQGVSTKPTKS